MTDDDAPPLKTTHAADKSRDAAIRFLHTAFPAWKALADAPPSDSPPQNAAGGRRVVNAYKVIKTFAGRQQQYDLLTSGEAPSTMLAAINLIAEIIGAPPKKIEAVNEWGAPIDADDPTQWKNISSLTATFPDGMHVFRSDQLSRISITCPSKAIFERLADAFSQSPDLPPH